jgi:hypothetical protein
MKQMKEPYLQFRIRNYSKSVSVNACQSRGRKVSLFFKCVNGYGKSRQTGYLLIQ